MRFIREILTVHGGTQLDNKTFLAKVEEAIGRLPVESAAAQELVDSARYALVGERSRQVFPENIFSLASFAEKAAAFERAADMALDNLADQIEAKWDSVRFDAVITTTSTGNLMPGLSSRAAHRLGAFLAPGGPLIDLANVGCTGSLKALHLADALGEEFRNVLVISVEVPSTLLDLTSTAACVWKGNSTFGDGAAAVWVSSEAAPSALAMETFRLSHHTDESLELIRWGYGHYYQFDLAAEATFNRDVRKLVGDSLAQNRDEWQSEPLWAVHPAGISLLMRLTKKLGLSRSAIQPSADHFIRYSNMSSASILYVMEELQRSCAPQSAVNLLTLGAGFSVIYGRVRKEG